MKWETQLPDVEIVYGRQESVCERSRGRRVLHIGCVDAGLLKDRFDEGVLMHQKLAAVASDIWGVDVDEAGIEFLRSRGFNQLITADVTGPIPGLEGRKFDLIVASEVIEHLQNPGLFLAAVQAWMEPGVTELIVTVPNAFRVDTLLSLFRRTEKVHPDHNYWFSYRTATNVLAKAGYEIAEVQVYSLQPEGLLPDLLRFRGPRRWDTAAPIEKSGNYTTRRTRHARASLAWRAMDYLRSLPKRVLIKLLYAITPFWGDGLILSARLPARK